MIERLGSGNTRYFFLLPPPPPQAEVEEEEREWATSRYSPLITFTSRTSRRGSVGISEKSPSFGSVRRRLGLDLNGLEIVCGVLGLKGQSVDLHAVRLG